MKVPKLGFIAGLVLGLAAVWVIAVASRAVGCLPAPGSALPPCQPRAAELPPAPPPLPPSQMIAALQGPAPIGVTAAISRSSGGSLLAGNFGLIVPPEGSGLLSATIGKGGADAAQINSGGSVRFSPNGTLVEVEVRDDRGSILKRFDPPVQAFFKPNGADLAMAGGDPSKLMPAYAVDAGWPPDTNPGHFPVNTVMLPPSSSVKMDLDRGALSVELPFLPRRLFVVAKLDSYVQTIRPVVALFPTFDASPDAALLRLAQFSYLRVTGPQVGERLPVIDAGSGMRGFVGVAEVGLSGPPVRD